MGENEILAALRPMAENWLRGIVADEVRKAITLEKEAERPEKMYSRDEVCEMLHITTTTLWTRTKEGKINAVKNGRRVLYAESQVKRLMGV